MAYTLSKKQMLPNPAPKIAITKLEAARRQLRVAISLWFQDGDEVAIHTLAGAAHQIIHDINRHRCGDDLLFDSVMFRDEYRKLAVNWLKKDVNFFKHADSDPEGVTDFAPMMTQLYILMSLKGLRNFGLTLNPVESAFSVWFMVQHPEFMTDEGAADFAQRVPIHQREDFVRMNPREFFELFQIARERYSSIR